MTAGGLPKDQTGAIFDTDFYGQWPNTICIATEPYPSLLDENTALVIPLLGKFANNPLPATTPSNTQ